MTISIEAVIQRIIEHDDHGLPDELIEVLRGAESTSVEARMKALIECGDARAIPFLRWLIELIEVDGDPATNRTVFELARALKELGGEFIEEEAKKIRQAQEFTARPVAREGDDGLNDSGPVFLQGSGKAPGRNDPCWCGSGKKYKKCHQRTDEDLS